MNDNHSGMPYALVISLQGLIMLYWFEEMQSLCANGGWRPELRKAAIESIGRAASKAKQDLLSNEPGMRGNVTFENALTRATTQVMHDVIAASDAAMQQIANTLRQSAMLKALDDQRSKKAAWN